MGCAAQIKGQSLMVSRVTLEMPTFRAHCTVNAMASSSMIRPLRAISAIAKQHPCHLASPCSDSVPPNPIAPSEDTVPPGFTTQPNDVSMTGWSSVPANRPIVARMISSEREGGSMDVRRARYFALEYRTMVSCILAQYRLDTHLVTQRTHEIVQLLFQSVGHFIWERQTGRMRNTNLAFSPLKPPPTTAPLL